MSESRGGEAPGQLAPEGIPSRPLAQLRLAELRSYRQALQSEEDRVSYWRRVTHGRTDVLMAQSNARQPLTREQLVAALGDTATGARRRGLSRIAAQEPLPELPELDEMWSTPVDPSDEAAMEAALAQLRETEAKLTCYRTALLRRIDEVTVELIARYRQDPTLALDLLHPSGRS